MERNKHLIKIKLIFGIFIFLLGIIINFISSNYIYYEFNTLNFPKNPDIILDLFTKPHPNYMFFAEILLVICIFLFLFINYKDKNTIIEFLIIIGIFNVLRGLLIPVTILGGLNPVSFLAEYNTFAYGLFPSGHTAIPLAIYFTSKIKKLLFLPFCIVIPLFILISQQHYTIDIIASVIFVYSIKSFYDKNIR